MDLILETEVCHNSWEVGRSEFLGINEIPGSHIFVVENCRKKERRNLDERFVELMKDDIGKLKNKYPDKKILGVIQFKKGMPKTIEQIENAVKCGIFDNSDGACIYDKNPQQSLEEFKDDLPSLLKLTEGVERYCVLEMDGADVLEKVNLALENEIRNFILIAGDYNNETLWRQVIVSSILSNRGTATVLLPVRMNTTTGKSFIEKAQIYGATIVVHGMPFGGGKAGDVKYLDQSDMIYKIASTLPTSHLLRTNSLFSDLFDTYEGVKIKEYELSRICSLYEARLFCEANRRQIVV